MRKTPHITAKDPSPSVVTTNSNDAPPQTSSPPAPVAVRTKTPSKAQSSSQSSKPKTPHFAEGRFEAQAAEKPVQTTRSGRVVKKPEKLTF